MNETDKQIKQLAERYVIVLAGRSKRAMEFDVPVPGGDGDKHVVVTHTYMSGAPGPLPKVVYEGSDMARRPLFNKEAQKTWDQRAAEFVGLFPRIDRQLQIAIRVEKDRELAARREAAAQQAAADAPVIEAAKARARSGGLNL